MLISDIKQIHDLHMTVVRGRPRKCRAIIHFNGMTVADLGDGKWWSSWTDFDKYAYPPAARYGLVDTLLTCLHRLGLLDKKVIDQHLKLCDKHRRDEDRQCELPQLRKLAKKYGYRLTKVTESG